MQNLVQLVTQKIVKSNDIKTPEHTQKKITASKKQKLSNLCVLSLQNTAVGVHAQLSC